MTPIQAKILTRNSIEILLPGFSGSLFADRVRLKQGGVLRLLKRDEAYIAETTDLDIGKNQWIEILGMGRARLDPGPLLDSFYSGKPLGSVLERGIRMFRVFAPRASRVLLCLSRTFSGRLSEYPMTRDDQGIWEIKLEGNREGWYYGYRVFNAFDPQAAENPPLIIDPYSRAVATRNHYLNDGMTFILPETPFDWGKDRRIRPRLEDLVIYEMHVRDFSRHPSSGVPARMRGTYAGVSASGCAGGMGYLQSLGINAVEFLPVHEFANWEPDFQDKSPAVHNLWNPYSRNHWGYMTTCFFAPESYYASDRSEKKGGVCGLGGRAVFELKRLIRDLHRQGIAVILDVVYNHVSHYDRNPLKWIDREYYFRLDGNGDFLSLSGCGNDLKTERPMARRMIVDSILYWMREFHVDGFRFDLAAMLDSATLDAVTLAARSVNPDVILIAEPWGGGKYSLQEFSDRGWGAWNDVFRNAVKGEDPGKSPGFIFGKRDRPDAREALKCHIRGSLRDCGGPFHKAGHSVNYLECHDHYTLGDFIRIAQGHEKTAHGLSARSGARLDERQVRLNKLAALVLLTSRGVVMLHSGQEFARSKVIVSGPVEDPEAGPFDHNSYNKDNETNWLDFRQARINRGLLEYYRGLIAIRMKHREFRDAGMRLQFLDSNAESGIGFTIDSGKEGMLKTILVLINADPAQPVRFDCPAQKWKVLADDEKAGPDVLRILKGGGIEVPPVSGMVLVSSGRR
ncbi:pullulanase [bacterium]|nr:pullulanase [bacterium]